MTRVAIVGGGISGLSAAYFLGREGIPSILFERRERLGGVVRTERLGGCLVEAGPDSWLAEKAWMLGLVRDLGIGDQVLGSNDAKRRTYVVRKGRPVALPESMRLLAPAKPWQALTTKVLGPVAKVRMVLEWFRRPSQRGDRSVADFVRDHFGDEAVEYLAQPMLAGVYGSPPEELSARRVIPKFVHYEQLHGSVLRGVYRDRHRRPASPLFLSLRDGMETLVEALGRRAATSCRIVRDRVREITRSRDGWRLSLRGSECAADAVVLAVPAQEAGHLVAGADRDLALLLRGIAYTSSAVAALVYRRRGFGHPLDGFGLLVPRAERASLAACTWVGTKFDRRVPDERVLLRAFLAGGPATRALGQSEDSVLATADAELRKWMRFHGEPTAGHVRTWERAMPQYGVGHGELLGRIETRLESLPGLHLAGNGYDGLGIPDCVRKSERVAKAIASAA